MQTQAKYSFSNLLKLTMSLLFLSASAFTATADGHGKYVLNQQKSSLNFISTKNTHVTEQHSFDSFSGDISKQGALSIDIDLSSVNTIIPIRNERMRKMLFEVVDYPSATFTAKLNETQMALAAGQTLITQLDGALVLKGKSVPLTVDLALVGLVNGAIQATTTKPIILNTETLGVQEGIDALQQIAMLNSISKTVPVSFSVVFEGH